MSIVWIALIAGFIAGYVFGIGVFLALEMRYWAVGGEKLLLAYPYMIMQLFLDPGVRELPGVNEILEAMNTTDLGMIKDVANPLDL